MNKRTCAILSTTMISIATAACAFCISQTANAAETPAASSSANATVDSSKNNSSITTSNTETSSTTASSIATASIASSNMPNGGGSALGSTSAKSAKSIGEDRSVQEETPVFDTAANYKKTGEDDDSITYDYLKNPNKITNPFPEFISNKEIEDEFKKGVSISKEYFIPDSTESDEKAKPVDISNTKVLPKGKGTFKIYAVFKFADLAYPIQLYTFDAYQSRNGIIASDGSIYAGSDSTVKYVFHQGTFKLNGHELKNDSKNRILINVDKQNAPNNYFYFELTCPSNNELNERVLMNGGVAMTTGGYERTSLIAEYVVSTDAQFHFVDDLQYRSKNPNGVDKYGKLKQRGNSDQHTSLKEDEKTKGNLMSAKPFYEIEGLQDIDSKVTKKDKSLYYRSTGGDLKTPILSYEGDSKASDVYRPTLVDLTGKNIPGYVYWDNDIDKPNNKNHKFANDDATKEDAGNHYLSFAYEMKNGKPVKRLTRKHYYVTFRAIPTQLVVKYKKSDGSFEAGAKYELLGSGNAQIGNEFAAASSDVATSTKDDLVKMMKNKDSSLLHGSTGYLSNGAVYLLPGKYTVKPNVKAPEGYEWVVDSTDQSSNGSADINIGLQTGNAAVESVTFVLKKKPTPPTPPTPAGDKPNPDTKPKPISKPEPEAEPVPDLSVPVAPAPILPPAETWSGPEPAPALFQPEQPEQQPKHAAKRHQLSKTGAACAYVLSSFVACVISGAGLTLIKRRRNE